MSLIKNISDKILGRPQLLNEDTVRSALSSIMDPDLGKDIVTLGFVRNIQIRGTEVADTLRGVFGVYQPGG